MSGYLDLALKTFIAGLVLSVLFKTAAIAEWNKAVHTPARPAILVLDPVDNRTHVRQLEFGKILRSLLRRTGRWTMVGPEVERPEINHLKIPSPGPCRVFTCALEKGGIHQADFVLYGTMTYSLNLCLVRISLIFVPSTNIVWSLEKEIVVNKGKTSVAAIEAGLEKFLSEINPAKFIKQNVVPKMLLLSPWDFRKNEARRDLGNIIRYAISLNRKWAIIDNEEIRHKMQEYKLDSIPICRDLNCAFNQGSMFQSEYVIYSTVAELENLLVYNLNLLHMPSSTVIWVKSGETRIDNRDTQRRSLLNTWYPLFQEFHPDGRVYPKQPPKKLLAVSHFIENPDTYLNALLERIYSSSRGAGAYNFMEPTELNYLILSLGMRPSSRHLPQDTLFAIGSKIGVDYMVHIQYQKRGRLFFLQLSLYDIKQKMRYLIKSINSSEFRSLLKFTDSWMQSMSSKDLKQELRKKEEFNIPGWMALPVAAILGLMLGVVLLF